MSVDADSFDGTCDVWEESIRRARADRKCDACRETIRRGDRYHVTRSLYDGSWQNTDRCARCETMFQFLSDLMPRGEVCARELDCGHEWSENFKDPPPPEIEALAFLTPTEAQALLGSDGLRSQILAERRRVEALENFRSKAAYWFDPHHRASREWRRDVLARQAAEDAKRAEERNV